MKTKFQCSKYDFWRYFSLTSYTISPLRGLSIGANSPKECVGLLRIYEPIYPKSSSKEKIKHRQIVVQVKSWYSSPKIPCSTLNEKQNPVEPTFWGENTVLSFSRISGLAHLLGYIREEVEQKGKGINNFLNHQKTQVRKGPRHFLKIEKKNKKKTSFVVQIQSWWFKIQAYGYTGHRLLILISFENLSEQAWFQALGRVEISLKFPRGCSVLCSVHDWTNN